MGFITKHTDDKFFLIDNINTSIRDIISREIVSNILVHREFSSAFPAKLIIESDRIMTENWNRSQYPGKIDPDTFTPYPKNPILAKFFMNIGRAEALGSGVRNLYKYTRVYCDNEPSLEEGDVFKIFVPLKKGAKKRNTVQKLTERQMQILDIIKTNPKTQIETIMEKFKLSRRSVLREISEIKKCEKINYNKKSGEWNIEI